MSWSFSSCVQSWSSVAVRTCHTGWCGRCRWSALDRDAHRARGALDDLHGVVHVVRVEVDHLALGDLTDLVAGEPADLVAVRDARALREPGGLLDELGRRRGLGDEGEAAVLVDGDLDRDHRPALGLG